MSIEDRIYQTSGIHVTVFIKLTGTYGITIGELRHKIYLPSETKKIPEPTWHPAKEGENFNTFHWIDNNHSEWDKAQPVKKKWVQKFKIVDFLLSVFTARNLIEHTFQGPPNG